MTSASAPTPTLSDSNPEEEAATSTSTTQVDLEDRPCTADPALVPQSIENLPIALTVLEAAAVLRVGRTLAYELVHQWHATGGSMGLRSVRVGRSLRIPRDAILELLGAVVSAGPKEPGTKPQDAYPSSDAHECGCCPAAASSPACRVRPATLGCDLAGGGWSARPLG